MAKSSVLDEVLAEIDEPDYVRTSGGSKLDRILSDLSDAGCDSIDQLVVMLIEPTTTYDNEYMLDAIRRLCGRFEVRTRKLTTANLSQWRAKAREKAAA